MAIDEQRFSALVKEIRKQLSLSQEYLARELGVSFATVRPMWWFRGRRRHVRRLHHTDAHARGMAFWY